MDKYSVVLTLKGTGEAVTILKPQDILEFVNRYMGPDTEQYISDIITEYCDERGEEIDALEDVLEQTERIGEELAKQRINKKKIKNGLDNIREIIDQHI